MKIVAVCQRGNVRSVSMGYVLKDFFGHDAVAIGAETAGSNLKAFLFGWADKIIVMQPRFASSVPAEHSSKLMVCDVGEDTYHNFRNQELLSKVSSFIKENLD